MGTKEVIKNLVKMSAVALFFMGVVSFMPALVGGWLAYKAVDVIGGLAGAARRDPAVAAGAKAHRRNRRRRVYDPGMRQWNLHELPLDMHPTRTVGEGEAYFTCSGVENVVKGRYRGDDILGRPRVEFSMVIADDRKAEAMASYISEKGLRGTSVRRTAVDGRFEIVSDNAVDINDIVKEFYPPMTMKIEREVSTTRQYRIPGCASYEEAVKKYQASKDFLKPDNVYVSYRDTVDGVTDNPVGGGNPLSLVELPVGEYIIDVTSKEVYSKNVTVCAPLDCTPEAMRSLASDAVGLPGKEGPSPFNRTDDLVEDACSKEPVISDGLADVQPKRYLEYDGRHLVIDGGAEAGELWLVLRFRSLDVMERAVDGDVPLVGRGVFLDNEVPAPRDGEYVVSVPVDDALLSQLAPTGIDVDEVVREYGGCGVTREAVSAAALSADLQERGYAGARLTGLPDFGRATVNGVPLADYMEHAADGTVNRELDDAWLRDAAKIQAVDVELDMKKEQLVITSTVGTQQNFVTVTERRDLDAAEMEYMATRRAVTKAEARDLLMKMHPDYFETYRREGGRALYHDPLGDFVKGRSPRLAEDVEREQKQKAAEKKAAVKGNVKAKAADKGRTV